MVNAQEYLDQNYPKEQRNKITNLDIKTKDLEGDLDLSDFINLKKLNCSVNKLTSINLSNNRKIEWINCADNLLTDIDFSHQDPEKLQRIIIRNNNLSDRNLSNFLWFTNLRNLSVGNYDNKKISQGIYNRFHGSLEYLENLQELVKLDISGTDIDCGLEYLPINKLKNFYCARKRSGARIEEIKSILELSEQEALSKNEEDNNNKIVKIRAYQLFVRWQQRSAEIEQAQNSYLRSYQRSRRIFWLALRRVRHKLDKERIQLLLNLQAMAVHSRRTSPVSFHHLNDRLRQFKQELIEDFEELAKTEIETLCRAYAQLIETRALFNRVRREQQSMDNLMQVGILLHQYR